MIRRLGRFLLPLLYAVLALVLLPCVAEVWLRWQELRAGRPLLSSDSCNDLVAPSWIAHHQLKPLRSVFATNPDTGERFETEINSFGLRGPEPAIPKPADTIRVLVLGDETVFGLETPDADTFCAQLEKRLKATWRQPVEVINGAVPGDCPLLAAVRLKHNFLTFRPDLVLCHFDMTDVADDYAYRRHTQLGRGEEPLACPNPLLEKPCRGISQEWGDHFLVAKWGQRQLAKFWRQKRPDTPSGDIDHPLGKYVWLEDDPPDWSVHIQQAFTSLGHVNKATFAAGSRLLITTCPAPWQVSSTASNGDGVRQAAGVAEDAHYRSDLPFRLLAEFSKQRGLAFFDASPAFQEDPHPDRLFLQNSAQLSAEGHALYAERVAQFLAENSHRLPSPTADGANPRSSGRR